MSDVLNVARYLVKLAGAGEEPDPLTNLRLQKLLYYAQGWHLAVFGRPLFPNRIEAWRTGPVVPDAYHSFETSGNQTIPTEEGKLAEGLGAAECAFLDAVWEKYKHLSASALLYQAHREGPWLDARNGSASDEPSNREISPALLRDFFAAKVTEGLVLGLDPGRAYESLDQLATAPGRPAAEVFARLRKRPCPTS